MFEKPFRKLTSLTFWWMSFIKIDATETAGNQHKHRHREVEMPHSIYYYIYDLTFYITLTLCPQVALSCSERRLFGSLDFSFTISQGLLTRDFDSQRIAVAKQKLIRILKKNYFDHFRLQHSPSEG